jgi:hypothetical protein
VTNAACADNTITGGLFVQTIRLRVNDTHDVDPKSTGMYAVAWEVSISGVRSQISESDGDHSQIGENFAAHPVSGRLSCWFIIGLRPLFLAIVHSVGMGRYGLE